MSSAKKSNDIYLIDLNNYEVIKNINQGGFGIINLVRNKKNGEQYASKTNLIPNKSQNKQFISREVHILIQVQHPTIIRFRGFSYVDFKGDKNITILMDYMKEGSLADLISKEYKSLAPLNYDDTKRQIILVGIARGMMILHARCVIHRDLKPENILLDAEFHPCITDFGLSKFFDPHHSMSQSFSDTGTAAYMAPEVITSDHFNTKADVYAFGILMYEVVSGKRAYAELFKGRKKMNQFELKSKVKEGLRPKFDFPIKKGLKRMIEKCWSKEPKDRPTFEEIFKKLSLSSEDYFLEFEGNRGEPKIPDYDEEEEDENEEDDDDEEADNLNKKFCLKNVNVSELLDYVDEIKEEPTKMTKSTDKGSSTKLQEEVKQMKKMIEDQAALISSLQTELTKVKKEKDDEISSLQKKFGRFISIEPSLNEPGILNQLKNRQKSHFDRQFVACQSSADIYNILVPDGSDDFCTNNSGTSFIEFELETAININGFQLFASDEGFPKSFDISVDGAIVKSVKKATELNGKYKNTKIGFDPILAHKVRFIQTGMNWDKGNNFIHIKRMELLSPDEEYSKGVFATMIDENETKDPHKIPVHITASSFDFNYFHLIDAPRNISTYPRKNSWFQVELTKGVAILTGFRFQRCDTGWMRNYKIVASDDLNKPDSSWMTLIEINEKNKNDHKQLDCYEFDRPSPPVRFVRLVSTGPTWDDNFRFKFVHFDLFGTYF